MSFGQDSSLRVDAPAAATIGIEAVKEAAADAESEICLNAAGSLELLADYKRA